MFNPTGTAYRLAAYNGCMIFPQISTCTSNRILSIAINDKFDEW